MITKILWFKNLKGLNRDFINIILVIGVVLLFMFSPISIAYLQQSIVFQNNKRAIVWDVLLNFNELGGAYDYAIFGEATDANDGPPADIYDTVKPPAPMPPYIRTWFDDNLPSPYDQLWEDYRHSPGITKTWNLTVQWVPTNYISPTTITLTWSPSSINATEYSVITLCNEGGAPLKNMRVFSSYVFNCPAMVPQSFKIICLVNNPPNPPSNPNPTNNSGAVPVDTDLSWSCSDPDADPLTYNVYFGPNSSPPKIADNISGTTQLLSRLNPGMTYYWRIEAWDDNYASTSGPLWHFHTNNLPNKPSNPYPSNNTEGPPLNTILSWTCTDPNSDPLTYDVFFGTITPPPIVVSNQTALSYDPPGNLSYGITYYWKIIAWDLNSGSNASPLWQFKTNSLPYIPSNPTPSNGSINVLITTNLNWIGGDPDSLDTVTYDVYIGLTSNPSIVAHNMSSPQYDLPVDLEYLTTYYWKIKSWDNHGASRTGPLWHFTTEDETEHPPNPPSNPYPSNGSTNIALNADLSWFCNDPDEGDTLTYDVYFGTTSQPPCVSHNQSVLTFDPGNLASFTMYYWKITAWDNHNQKTVGSLWHFRTKFVNAPPFKPDNESPTNCSTQIPVNVDLKWTGGDPDSGDPVTYDIYFGMTFPLPKIKSNISSTSCFLSDLNYSQQYYWRVIAWDSYGAKNISDLWHFTTKIDTTPPSLGISQPKKGYLYVNILNGMIQWKFPIFITTIVIGPIEVIATASDGESGVDRVEFYLGDELQSTDYIGENNQYTWDWVEHGGGFPYVLKAIAYDKCGNHSEWIVYVWKIF